MNREEFLSKFDFDGYVRSRFSPIIETSDEDRVRVCCPMCEETSGHLYILISAGLPYCQRCKYDPKSPVRFIADVEGVTFSDVYKMCGDQLVGVDTSVEEAVESLFDEEEKEYFEYEVMEFPKDTVSPLGPVRLGEMVPLERALDSAREYLEAREVTHDEVQKYNIKYCYSGQYSGRLIVPCFYEEDLVTFVGRDIFGYSSRKYLNPTGNKQSDFLFNLDNVEGDTVVLTEGVFDAISVARAFPAVASFGKSLSKRQIKLLNNFQVVIFYWDKDAYPQAEKYASLLQTECRVVLHSDGEDAGSRSLVDNKNLVNSAVYFNSVDYEMFKLLQLSA